MENTENHGSSTEGRHVFFPSKDLALLWRIPFPKVYMLQDFASSWIVGQPFNPIPPAYVWANVLFYTAALGAIALWRFHNMEI